MIFDTDADIVALRGPVPLSHLFLRRFVGPGSNAVDATCGNGHDTRLLAELTGASGRVWAFDIQEEAIRATGDRLAQAGLSGRVSLIQGGHETMAEHVPATQTAIVFNLGYRPGGNRSIVTLPETTLAAFRQALQLLLPAGILAATVYPGHASGAREHDMIETWAGQLEPQAFHVWRMGQLNAATGAPYFILIQKAG
ncbi:class I SAM-dependent methyltransferase [Geobacter sp. SVR]|uniref:class I SAM-dependent methyltransferase n=1 Tax=Geobacter sp. SVR TaxID=2495594 RepID=UPI00143EFBE0|nr:class I SAM-dependent methyltransferase [Geobacter sp. SVR]BCS55588.1 rRNA methyltransferase [Geobacter sp. SVR]GCF83591.1 rRNA methyltransferase [Geobacter sp. SVR]